MAAAKRELFKSADVCEMAQLQPYVLRSWEAEFPGLGKPASAGAGRMYRRDDVALVLSIKQMVFGEVITLSGARRRLEEEEQGTTPSVAAAAVEDVLDGMARSKLRKVRSGLEAILEMLSRDTTSTHAMELQLVAPPQRAVKAAAGKKSRAS